MKLKTRMPGDEKPTANLDGNITVLKRIDPETGVVTEETIEIGGAK